MKSEFQFIHDIKERFSLSYAGDDCAVLPKDHVADLLITADLLIENVDFRLKWAKPADVGYKALAVSLSDIAAMGGIPTFALVSLGVPVDLWNSNFLDEFYEGWHSLATEFGVKLVGGDVSSAHETLVIDSIVLGEVPYGKAIRRSGAKVGDLIYVSGVLGGAAAGLRLLDDSSAEKSLELVQKQLRPTPQVILGKQLRDLGIVTSMIDVSDGLSSDLRHICEASGVGAKIEAEQLPIDLRIDPDMCGKDGIFGLAMNGGEDFELLMTIASDGHDLISELPLTRIGIVTDSGKLELKVEGSIHEISPGGYRHF